MNLPKAIEILKGTPGPTYYLEGQDAHAAAQLGIEALKFRLSEEKRTPYLAYAPLPGETPPEGD